MGGIFMYKRKVTPEEKIHAVEAYLRGEITVRTITNKCVVAKNSFYKWVRNYEVFGPDGLRDKHRKTQYSVEVRMAAVRDYLSGVGSQDDICKKYKIFSQHQLQNWIKLYNSHKELRSNTGRGSDIYMTKGRNTTYEERVEIVSYCIGHGNDYTATIEKYGVSYQQIYSWVRKYNEKGAEGLVDKRGKRKPESEMTELEKLRAENRMLAARNKRLETECAVLKKLEEIERRWR
jgi:transposase-like protein